MNFCLQNRKTKLVGLNTDDILCGSPKISESLSTLLRNLEKRICSLDDVDYAASLMAGQRLALMSNPKKNGKKLEVTVEQLESALQLASTMNYKLFHEEIHDSDPLNEGRSACNETSSREILVYFLF